MDLNRKTKNELRAAHKTDRDSLFEYAWRKIRWFNANADIDDLQGLYDSIVSETVNNPKSKFYIYG